MLMLCTAILDLQKLLANRNTPLDMPEHLILQFDNCSENKVRYIIYIQFIYLLIIIFNCYLLSEQIHVRLHFIAHSR